MRVQTAAVAPLLFVVTGCVQLPVPISGVERPRPAMTMADAEHLHDLLEATLKKADRKRSQGVADDVLSGTDLAGQVSDYDKFERFGFDFDPLTQGVKILGVHSSEASTYPQRSVVVSTQKPTKQVKDYRLLEVWTRASAADRWLRESSVSISAKYLPAIRTSDGIATFIASGTVGGLPVDTMKPLAEALDRPARQRAFKPDDFLAVWRDWSKDDIKELSNSNISMAFTGGRHPTVIATEDGGALIVGKVTITQTAQVKDLESGEYIYWPKGSMRRAFPGHYRTTVDSYLMTALVIVPPTGKPDLHSFTYWWLGTNAFP